MKTKQKGRPFLPNKIIDGASTNEEVFQNKVVRPIIKMQSDILIAHLNQQLKNSKITLNQLSNDKKEATLVSLFTKNLSFKKEISGMIIGHFTIAEYETYLSFTKEINRRINQIVLNRCIDLIIDK